MKKVSANDMSKIQGGVPRAEYCATLWMIMTNNPVSIAMINAWETNCQAQQQ